ncbi:hypothetical protein Tco_0990773 [Tanacetum coccineum]|uniref:Zinc finger, CCHC-type, retrotransposon Gag domain protein n=1 Tax=Tanacetum coccineum TaxID=301880 RepID=A0ABQ5EY37_9ASTR
MPPKAMSQAAIERLITQRVNAAVEAERERQVNARGQGNNANEAGGQGGAPAVRECTFSGFMKCNPTVFHGHEGAVELSRWFEKTEMVFGISECAEARKVKFAAATLQGRALTWWNSQVATRGLEAANQIGWTEMRGCEEQKAQLERKGLPRAIKENGKVHRVVTTVITETTIGTTTAITSRTIRGRGMRGKMAHKNYARRERIPQAEKARGRAYMIKDTEKHARPKCGYGDGFFLLTIVDPMTPVIVCATNTSKEDIIVCGALTEKEPKEKLWKSTGDSNFPEVFLETTETPTTSQLEIKN